MKWEDMCPYQLDMSNFVENTPKAALFAEMGLGKTVSSLTAITTLLDMCDVRRVLVIAPLRVAKHTWPYEINKWEHVRHNSFKVITGSAAARSKIASAPADIHITNRENIHWLIHYFKKDWPYDMVVIDESTSFKNHKSLRFKALKKVLAKLSRVVLLTGTPAPNGLLDLWAQIYLLDGGERLGKTFSAYRNKYFTSDYMGYTWTLKPNADRVIHNKLSDICLTLKTKDYVQLPERIDNYIYVDIGPQAWKVYEELEKEMVVLFDKMQTQGEEIVMVDVDDANLEEVDVAEAVTMGVLKFKMFQVSKGAIYLSGKAEKGRAPPYKVLHDAKINALESIINEAMGEPVLVAYHYQSDLERIKERFPKAVGMNDEMHGKDVIEEWNAGNIPILLAHPASAGHGLNLQFGGSIVAWFGVDYNLEQYLQFNARLHRRGQQKPVFIHHIISQNTVDEDIVEALGGKHKGQEELLEAFIRRARE